MSAIDAINSIAKMGLKTTNLEVGNIQFPTAIGSSGQVLGVSGLGTLGFISNTPSGSIEAGANITVNTVSEITTISLDSAISGLTGVSTSSLTVNNNIFPATLGSVGQVLTVESVIGGPKMEWATPSGGVVDVVSGTTNQISVVSTDPSNPIISLTNNVTIGGYLKTSSPFTNTVQLDQNMLLATSSLDTIAIGANALNSVVSSTYNVAVGYNAGANLSSGSCTFVGNNAGDSVSSGFGNTAFGCNALSGSAASSIGSGNIAIGYSAISSGNTSGSNNTGIGTSALASVTSGEYNICIGMDTGDSITSGSENVIIGAPADKPTKTVTGSNNIIIGSVDSTADKSNQIIIGNSTASSVALGSLITATPSGGTVCEASINAPVANFSTVNIIGAPAVLNIGGNNFPSTLGSNGQFLTVSSGAMAWTSSSPGGVSSVTESGSGATGLAQFINVTPTTGDVVLVPQGCYYSVVTSPTNITWTSDISTSFETNYATYERWGRHCRAQISTNGTLIYPSTSVINYFTSSINTIPVNMRPVFTNIYSNIESASIVIGTYQLSQIATSGDVIGYITAVITIEQGTESQFTIRFYNYGKNAAYPIVNTSPISFIPISGTGSVTAYSFNSGYSAVGQELYLNWMLPL
jgi:hypothetical protein